MIKERERFWSACLTANPMFCWYCVSNMCCKFLSGVSLNLCNFYLHYREELDVMPKHNLLTPIPEGKKKKKKEIKVHTVNNDKQILCLTGCYKELLLCGFCRSEEFRWGNFFTSIFLLWLSKYVGIMKLLMFQPLLITYKNHSYICAHMPCGDRGVTTRIPFWISNY